MKSRESGSTVVLSMIVIVVLAMCVAGALDYTLQTFRDTQQTNARAQAITAATGALDLAFVQFREACRLQENQDLTASAITSGSAWSPMTSYSTLTGASARAGSFMNIAGVTNPITVTLKAMDATNPNAVASATTSGSAVPTQAQSLTMPTWSYLCTASASYQSLTGTQTVNVSRIFQKVTQSPWQYAIFYNDDLEINPGTTMNITGAVQTNGSLYTAGESGVNHLTFDGAVNFAGSWNPNGQYDPDDLDNKGDPVAPPAGTTPTAGPQQLPQNSALFNTTSTNPNLSDGYHEIIEPPTAGYTDPLAGTATTPSERYYNQAGIKILVTGASRTSPTVSIYDAAGNLCTATSGTTTVDYAIYKAISPAITTNATLQDGRENARISLTTLDMSQVATALNGPLSQDGCSVIYVDDETSAAAAGTCGVELINGYKAPSGGVTVVSGNPVYIVGDFNTATSTADISNVPSNASNSNPLIPHAPDYTPQSCAVMADAVTILSNGWVNSDGSAQLNSSARAASNTTINAAILSGIVTSGPGFEYSGGVENFLRLLENWSGKTLTYYGSLVELFNSMQGTGLYQEPGAYYNFPVRQWYFNVAFYSQPPPGTFEVITYAKSRWFIQ